MGDSWRSPRMIFMHDTNKALSIRQWRQSSSHELRLWRQPNINDNAMNMKHGFSVYRLLLPVMRRFRPPRAASVILRSELQMCHEMFRKRSWLLSQWTQPQSIFKGFLHPWQLFQYDAFHNICEKVKEIMELPQLSNSLLPQKCTIFFHRKWETLVTGKKRKSTYSKHQIKYMWDR